MLRYLRFGITTFVAAHKALAMRDHEYADEIVGFLKDFLKGEEIVDSNVNDVRIRFICSLMLCYSLLPL